MQLPLANFPGMAVPVGHDPPQMAKPTINEILQTAVEANASDLHLRTGLPPSVRVRGDIQAVAGTDVLDNDWVKELVVALLPGSTEEKKNSWEKLRKERELDTAYSLPGIARFRVNLFFEQGTISAVLRRIPEEIPRPEEIGLPPIMTELGKLQRGLVLVTGPTGSGKSTSLAAVIRSINEGRPASILTLEDPIEFVHEPARCIVRQREVGRDMHSFGRGLRAALRQDPDVILVGEMRDHETIEIALTAAETGHLVFGTLHTRSAESTIDRVVDVFPATQQNQIRTQLSNSLAAIMCQTLMPTADGKGRVAAHEVLIVNAAVRNMIRHNKGANIRSAMQTGAREGMMTMDKSLAILANSGKVSLDEARSRAQDTGEFDKLVGADSANDAPPPGKGRRGRSSGITPPPASGGVSMDEGDR